jgi:hypothetical protein
MYRICHYVINCIFTFVLHNNAVNSTDFTPLNYYLINERLFGIDIKNSLIILA